MHTEEAWKVQDLMESLFILFIVTPIVDQTRLLWLFVCLFWGGGQHRSFFESWHPLPLPYSIPSIYFLLFPLWTSAVRHLPPWACLNTLTHGKKKPSWLNTRQPCSMPLGHFLWCWGLQRSPLWYRAIRSRNAPRHDSPGSAPKKAMFAFPLYIWNWQHLSLQQFGLGHHVQSLKTYSFTNGQPALLPCSCKAKTLKRLTLFFFFSCSFLQGQERDRRIMAAEGT